MNFPMFMMQNNTRTCILLELRKGKIKAKQMVIGAEVKAGWGEINFVALRLG